MLGKETEEEDWAVEEEALNEEVSIAGSPGCCVSDPIVYSLMGLRWQVQISIENHEALEEEDNTNGCASGADREENLRPKSSII